jgi:hypothetical protein
MPRGGKRTGAGRPKGSKDELRRGELSALNALQYRIPEGTSEADIRLADEARDTILKVMRGEVHHSMAFPRLKAATYIREEICGTLAQRLQLGGEGGDAIRFEWVSSNTQVRETAERLTHSNEPAIVATRPN